jgi:hypothetical protein
MAQPQQQVYPFDIPTYTPAFLSMLFTFFALALDQNIVLGDPIDPLDAKRAEGAATSAHLQGEYIIHQPLSDVLTQFTTSARAGHYG